MTGKGRKQDCTKRSLVYETWCETCKRTELEKIDMEEIEEEEKKRKKAEMKVHKYVGETARSAFERGLEHRNALEKLDEDSHMLKHIANYHKEMEVEDVKFGMRVVSFTRTALERQVLESVKIQEERERNWIMNSRSEYSRSTIPRLTAKMGEKDYDKLREKERPRNGGKCEERNSEKKEGKVQEEKPGDPRISGQTGE